MTDILIAPVTTNRLSIHWSRHFGKILLNGMCIGAISVTPMENELFIKHIQIFDAFQHKGYASEIIEALNKQHNLSGFTYPGTQAFWVQKGASIDFTTPHSCVTKYGKLLVFFKMDKNVA